MSSHNCLLFSLIGLVWLWKENLASENGHLLWSLLIMFWVLLAMRSRMWQRHFYICL